MFKCIFYALFSFFRIRNFVGKHALVSILAVNVLSEFIFYGYFLCRYFISISGYILILILHFRFRYGYDVGAGLEGELFLNWETPYPGDYESEILGP